MVNRTERREGFEERTKGALQRYVVMMMMKKALNALSSHNLIVSMDKAIECRIPLST